MDNKLFPVLRGRRPLLHAFSRGHHHAIHKWLLQSEIPPYVAFCQWFRARPPKFRRVSAPRLEEPATLPSQPKPQSPRKQQTCISVVQADRLGHLKFYSISRTSQPSAIAHMHVICTLKARTDRVQCCNFSEMSNPGSSAAVVDPASGTREDGSAEAVEEVKTEESPLITSKTSLRGIRAARANARSLAAARQQLSSQNIQINPEAQEKFEGIWKSMESRIEKDACILPKEIVWLNGAPGAGKGANTPFILKTRGFQAKAIQMSDLLQDSPDVAHIMKTGGLVSDSLVMEVLLEAILDCGLAETPEEDGDHTEVLEREEGGVAGVVVDGFPRTTIQVDFVKLLYDKLMELHYANLNTEREKQFPRPIFRIAVLYVEEEESVRRQLARGQAAITHNQRAADSGVGELKEVRPTDLDEKAARRRYQIFREHYDTLLRLKAFFPFHLIDGMGSLGECREQIEKELQYQSALELDATTFRAISHIPLAADIAKQARQQMVARLDAYEKHDHHTFKEVIDVIGEDLVPIIRRCALSGIAVYNTERPVFFDQPIAAEMLADIMSERGYFVTWQARTREVPLRIDPATYNIMCTRRTTLQFRVKFERPHIRSSSDQSSNSTSPSSPGKSFGLLSNPTSIHDAVATLTPRSARNI